MTKTIAIVSGGMDSTVLAYLLKNEGHDTHMISFDYGQRHRKEIAYAAMTAKRLGFKHDIVDLQSINPLLQGSSLTTEAVAVPDGHYAEETMKITVVPNRNAIMLSIAYGAAVSEKAQFVAAAMHAGDHFIYPDCRPDFIMALNKALIMGNEGFMSPNITILTPFIDWSKALICGLGDKMGVHWEETWSCYKGLDKPCGSCGTCIERREAFILAKVIDPTEYLETPPIPVKA